MTTSQDQYLAEMCWNGVRAQMLDTIDRPPQSFMTTLLLVEGDEFEGVRCLASQRGGRPAGRCLP